MPQKRMARPRKAIDLTTYEGRFAARLKLLREKAGLTVQEVAEAMGVTLKTIYSYEDGTFSPTVGSLPALAKLYGLKKINALLPGK